MACSGPKPAAAEAAVIQFLADVATANTDSDAPTTTIVSVMVANTNDGVLGTVAAAIPTTSATELLGLTPEQLGVGKQRKPTHCSCTKDGTCKLKKKSVPFGPTVYSCEDKCKGDCHMHTKKSANAETLDDL